MDDTFSAVSKAQIISDQNYQIQVSSEVNNTYVQIAVDENGKFTIGTKAGNPSTSSDDNANLMYGHPSPSTSDTLIKIDGTVFSIHSGSSTGLTLGADSIAIGLTVNDILITQTLSIIDSFGTNNKDTVLIHFKLTNNGGSSHNVSMRTQLDTQLGTNDGAPFRVSDVGAISTDTEFDNDSGTSILDIPSQAIVLDSLTAPTIIALFTFKGLGFQTPDRIVLGYWPAAVGNYNYTVDSTRSFLDNDNDGEITGSNPDSDSAVNVYWGYPDANAFSLSPGESIEFAIAYGIGDCAIIDGTPLKALLCGPSKLTGEVSGTSYKFTPDPYNLEVFLTNVSNQAVTDASVSLLNSSDIELTTGESNRTLVNNFGASSIGVGGSTQVTYKITSNGRIIGDRQVGIVVRAGGNQYNALKAINVLGIPDVLYGKATDESGNAISGAAITVFFGDTIVGSATTDADGRYVVSGLSPGKYRVRLSANGRVDTYFDGLVSADATNADSSNPSGFSAGAPLESFSYPNPIREGSARITFYAGASGTANIKIFDSIGRHIKETSLDVPEAGWQIWDWAIDNVVNGIYFYQIKFGGEYDTGKIAVIKRVQRR